MEFRLAEGERIVKEYDCATARVKGKNGKQTVNSTLVVTNRRVVQRNMLTDKKMLSIANKEIPISAVKFVDVSYTKMHATGIFLFLALLSLLAAVFFVVDGKEDIGFFFSSLALFCFVMHFAVKKSGKIVTLEFVLATDIKKNFSISHGATSGVLGKRSSSTKVMNVTVDEEVAFALVQELGAVILDAQNDVCPPADAENN